MRPFRLAPSLVAIVSVCCACGVGPGPRVHTRGTVAGEYVMVERNGGRLPHVMRAGNQTRTCQTELVRAVLTLRADGSAAEEVEARVWCNEQPRPDTTFTATSTGSFTLRGVRGDSITAVMTQTDPAEVMKGVITGDELRMHDETAPGTPVRSYRYVRQR
jgi:hypothetical protein